MTKKKSSPAKVSQQKSAKVRHAELLMQEHHNLWGILFMLLNAVAIAVLYAAIKNLTKDMSSSLVVFIYKFSILVLIIPWCLHGGLQSLKTKRLFLHLSRGCLSICGSLCLFFAIKYIELVDITAIGYMEQVILVIIGIMYFKEKATHTKIATIILSFVGAMLVVYPDVIAFNEYYIPTLQKIDVKGEFNKYYIFVFLSIAFWATNCTVIKVLGKTEKTKVQLFYVMLISCVIAYPLAFMHWSPSTIMNGLLEIKYPDRHLEFSELGLQPKHIPTLALLSLCYFVHSIAFFKALKYAELSTVIPFDYSRLVFTGILGFIFFNEIPNDGSYIGYLLIVGAGVYLIRSESKRRRKKKEQLEKEQIEEAELENA